MRGLLTVVAVAALGLSGLAWSEDAPAAMPAPEDGEKRLDGAAAEEALGRITEGFRRQPCVRASVTKEIDDPLLGKETWCGQLALKRPAQFRLSYQCDGRPGPAWRLNGPAFQEFNRDRQEWAAKEVIRDAKKLAFIQAALSLDVAVLREYFDVTVFRKRENAAAPAQWRLVLLLRPGVSMGDWRRIEGRLADGAAFFSEIQKVPAQGKGDPSVERYTEITAPKDIPDSEFGEEGAAPAKGE